MHPERTYSGGDEIARSARIWLIRRGVAAEDIAELVYVLQKDYIPGLTRDECLENVEHALSKRDVQNAVLTGIQLDELAEQGKLTQPLLAMIREDDRLYGCDEALATAIVGVYGTIGLTNYGYIDRLKPGILRKLDDRRDGETHTFLDDIVGALAAAAASRIAHRRAAERV